MSCFSRAPATRGFRSVWVFHQRRLNLSHSSRFWCALFVFFCRLDKIAEGLKSQEKKQADYKKSLPPKPISEGLLQYVKKNAWER